MNHEVFDISDEEALVEALENSPDQVWRPRSVISHKNLKQTTLFGTDSGQSQVQSDLKHNWPLANRQEKPTHHKLNGEEVGTWVYPTNLGTIREYQFNIVSRGLYHNLLVALPTGLGKTFIAATIMLNWFRWTKDAQIIFVAPTKPLVSQQVEACFQIAGIPRSATTMLTGGIAPGVRAEEWESKRVFFMTPQTLINDLKQGSCDPKRVVLLVVDEAHRATGGYAYVEVVKFLRRFNTSFRVLALTATPGSTVESVQAVIDGLGISRVEIRTEESLDIRQYVHPRTIETQEFEPSYEMQWIFEELSKALQPLVDLMRGKNAYWSKDPMSLTAYGCNQARIKWMNSDAGRRASMGEKGQVFSVFSTLASLAHSIELLKFHGIVPFYHKIRAFKDEGKSGKYVKQVNENQNFLDVLAKLRIWVLQPDFIGHPKLDHLQGVVLEHFVSANEGRHSDPEISANKTRIMIFVHFRDSAEEIVRVLNRNSPIVRAHVFVGQANAGGSDGMNQKKQLEIVEQFRQGTYNTLVATSIGEEGLDIGEIDLIICYDASASPIRMLQRMGRTGRKRAGEIVVLLMKGKEADNFAKARDNYEKMQLKIANGKEFTFHTDTLSRILPKEIQPLVDKRLVEIPIENSQPTLPVPDKRKGRKPRKIVKKFHMPDGVETGFTTATRVSNVAESLPVPKKAKPITKAQPQIPKQKRSPTPVPRPLFKSVFLSSAETAELERNYLHIPGDESQTVEPPRLDAFPSLQKASRPIVHIKHGTATIRMQRMLTRVSRTNMSTIGHLEANLDPADTAAIPTNFIHDQRKTQRPLPEKPDADMRREDFDSTDSEAAFASPETSNEVRKPFWTSPAKIDAEDLVLSQDLPDLSTLLDLDKVISTRRDNDFKPARLKRRLVVESDSDSDDGG